MMLMGCFLQSQTAEKCLQNAAQYLSNDPCNNTGLTWAQKALVREPESVRAKEYISKCDQHRFDEAMKVLNTNPSDKNALRTLESLSKQPEFQNEHAFYLIALNYAEYETLLNAFIAFYENVTADTYDPLDNELHNVMASFMEEIANTIYNYAQINNIDNVSEEYCTSLAWGTMIGTDLFTEMLSEPEQINANNILITEQNNTEYDPSTPVKGNSCN